MVAQLPNLLTILVASAIDSINPCAIGVLILLISTLLAFSHNRRKMLWVCCIYIVAIYITYFLAGLGLTAGFHFIPIRIAEYISMGVAVLVIFGGLIEIKDFFWYGQGVSLMLTPKELGKIKEYAKNTSIPGVILLGIFVAAVELPCTGGPYLAITAILAQSFNLQAVYLLLIYNVVFVMPLVVILFLVYFGSSLKKIKNWKMDNKAYMRLATGLIMIALGYLLMLIANGTINLN